MRAVAISEYGDPDVLDVIDRDRPSPDAGELLIEVDAAGINFADLQQRMGTYVGGPEPPFVPGFEVAGRVVEAGDGVSIPEGTTVAGTCKGGGYAEYAIADARSVFPVPTGLSAAEAAGVTVHFLTAHGCLFDRGGLESGERVLIHAAAGGVGSAAVQLAATAGAEVFGTASSEEKLEHIRSLGCDHAINYEQTDFADEIATVTDGDGIDLIIDGVGGDVFRSSMDALAHFGRLVTMGIATHDPASASSLDLLYNNQQVIGFHLGNTIARDPERALAPLSVLLERLAGGELEVVIGREYPLEQAAEAHRWIESRSSIGKVILTP